MSRPHVSPDPEHFEQASLTPALPPGWIREFDSQHSLPYYVDIRDPNHPRSQWAIPYYYSTNAPQALASGFQDTDSTRGIISKLENHLLPHHQLQYNSDFQKGNKPSSGYQVGYIGQNQHYQPEHTQSASSHSSGSSWLSAGAARVGGMAVGAFLDHEWEKHKQGEACQAGLRHEAAKEKALEVELARIKAENIQLRTQQTQVAQSQYLQRPYPSDSNSTIRTEAPISHSRNNNQLLSGAEEIYSKESVCRMGGEQALGKGMDEWDHFEKQVVHPG